MKIKKFNNYYLKESIVDPLKYEGFEKALVEILYKNVDTGRVIEIKQYITRLEKDGISDVSIEGFLSDEDWFDFYLKFKDEIDDILSENEYFELPPSERNIFNLYDIIINGTQKAVLEKLKEMKKDF